MDAQRFFSVAYDSRNHPKVDMLRCMEGGIVAYGRFIALLGILYDLGNEIDLTGGADGLDDAKAMYLVRQLEFADADGLEHFLDSMSKVGLIDADAWDGYVVTSHGVAEELAYKAKKSAAGKLGGRPRKHAEKNEEKQVL